MGGLGVNTQVAAAQMDEHELSRFKTEMASIKDKMAGGKDREAQLRKACQNFEAVFISKLWQQMKQTVPKDSGMHGQQEEMYVSMFDKDFSEKMAEDGGIGLGDMLYDQLSQRLKDTSRDTLNGTVKPFNEPTPAFPLAKAGIELKRPERTLEDWTGQEIETVPTPNDIVSGLLGEKGGDLSESEVETRLEALTQRLESQLKTRENAASLKVKAYGEDEERTVGRNFAKIG